MCSGQCVVYLTYFNTIICSLLAYMLEIYNGVRKKHTRSTAIEVGITNAISDKPHRVAHAGDHDRAHAHHSIPMNNTIKTGTTRAWLEPHVL